jgi:AcrR family transcriptional regulator
MSTSSTAASRSGATTPARAPRLRKSAAERRAEVADAARALAREQGLAAVTLRAVAARVGVAPGLVAHYAPSMDDLVADTFGDLVATELRDIVTLVQRADPAPRRLGILLETLLDGSRSDITLVWVQAWAMGAGNEALATRVRTEMDDWQDAIAAEIARGMDDGSLVRGDAAGIAWHLLAMIDGLNAHSLVRWNDRPDRVTLAARAIAGLVGVDPAELTAASPSEGRSGTPQA